MNNNYTPPVNGVWFKKPTIETVKGINSFFQNTLPYTLSSCNVKSTAQNTGFMIEIGGSVVFECSYTNIAGWKVESNSIVLYTNDGMTMVMNFLSSVDSQMADTRLYLIINGNYINGCDDASLYNCGNISSLEVTFS